MSESQYFPLVVTTLETLRALGVLHLLQSRADQSRSTQLIGHRCLYLCFRSVLGMGGAGKGQEEEATLEGE